MAADALAMLYALLGGVFMGSYPVPIKSGRVRDVCAHPVVFQCYKSVWAFAFALLLIGSRSSARGGGGASFVFTWWAVLSAAAWVPGGLCTIAAVPRLGVGLAVIISTGAASAASFLVFWLVLGEKMKQYGPPGARYFFAPVYFACVIGGMALLVAAPRLPDWGWREASAPPTGAPPADSTRVRVATSPSINANDSTVVGRRNSERDEGVDLQKLRFNTCRDSLSGSCSLRTTVTSAYKNAGDGCLDRGLCAKAEPHQRERREWLAGVALAFVAGMLSAAQFGIVSIGKRAVQVAAGCGDDFERCPQAVKEQFDPFGSWPGSFGMGALVVTGFYLAWVTLAEGRRPALHPAALGVPGSVAGVCWALGAFFQTAAAVRGGNAVMMPANYALQLVTSGAWGLLYYREVHGLHRIVLWILAAVWTLAMMVLLSKEKLNA